MSGPTHEEADGILAEVYNDSWMHDDTEWWQEMVEFVMEYDSVEAAREWLTRGAT